MGSGRIQKMGHMENAGLPQRILFYRPDRPFITQMVGIGGQSVRSPRSMGDEAQPMSSQ